MPFGLQIISNKYCDFSLLDFRKKYPQFEIKYVKKTYNLLPLEIKRREFFPKLYLAYLLLKTKKLMSFLVIRKNFLLILKNQKFNFL